MKKITFIILISICFATCKSSYSPEKEEAMMLEYIQNSGIENTGITPSGVYYSIIEKGRGKRVEPNSYLIVHYEGTFLDGTLFDNANSQIPYEFNLKDALKGWQEGLMYLNQGGQIKLIIPSKMAFGSKRISGIPPNTPLVYDITLLEVHNLR